MSGLLLIIMGLARLGRFIEFISLPVTLGFTSGIAITIGTMQIKDFFGLHTATLPEHYLGKVAGLLFALPTFTFADTLVGIVALAVLFYWPRLSIRLPPHLPALLAGVAVMGVLWVLSMPATTIGSRLSYLLADGTHRQRILAILPHWLLPWQLPGADGAPQTPFQPCCRRRFPWRCWARLNRCCVPGCWTA